MSSRSCTPTTSPNSSKISIATLELGNKDALTDAQVEICSRVRKIQSRKEAHPLSQLLELQQAGIILSFDKENLGTVDMRSTIRVNANINETISFTSTSEAASKKQAQKEAAEFVFEKIITFLRDHPPENRFIVALPVRKHAGPTAEEEKEMEEDQLHLSVLRQITVAAVLPPSGTIGVLSIDLEQYELNCCVPLEIGVSNLSLCANQLGGHVISAYHLIVEDHIDVVNGRYVVNNKNSFNFGESLLVKEQSLAMIVTYLLRRLCSGYDKVYLIGHTIQSDLKWLEQMGVTIPFDFVLCDSGRAYRGLLTNGEYINMMGMEKMTDRLGIEYRRLHNGGNDAYYNIEVLLKLVQMVGVEEQKEGDITR